MLFAAEVEGSVEVGGDSPRRWWRSPNCTCRRGGRVASWRLRWWSPGPDSRRGPCAGTGTGGGRGGEVYEGHEQAPPEEEEEEVLRPPCPGLCLLNEYKIKPIIPCTKKKKRTNEPIKKQTTIVLSTQQYDTISEYGVQQVAQNFCGTHLQKFSCSQTFLHFTSRLHHKHPLNLFTAMYKFCALTFL